MAYKELATKDYVNNKIVTIIDSFESEQSNFTPDEILQMVSDKKILMINGYICTIYDMYYDEETNILNEVDAIISNGNSYMDFCIYDDKTFDLYRSSNFIDDETFWNVINRLSEKQYELIKNITIENDSTYSLTINTDQNNNSFSLSAIRINFGLLTASSSAPISISCYNGTSIIHTSSNIISVPTSSPKMEKYCIKNDHGIWVVDDVFVSVANKKNITSIKITTNSGSNCIPKNSTIEVYGIRY